jgi:hypothetical protein
MAKPISRKTQREMERWKPLKENQKGKRFTEVL